MKLLEKAFDESMKTFFFLNFSGGPVCFRAYQMQNHCSAVYNTMREVDLVFVYCWSAMCWEPRCKTQPGFIQMNELAAL